MILRNFINRFYYPNTGSSEYQVLKSTGGYTDVTAYNSDYIRGTSDATFDNDCKTTQAVMNYPTKPLNRISIVVGSGDVAPTYDDYKMGNPLNLSTVTQSYSTNGGVMTFVKTFKNDSGSEVTVREVGLFGTPDNRACCVVLTRTVLSSPVTIANGETKTFTVVVDWNKFSEGYTIN